MRATDDQVGAGGNPADFRLVINRLPDAGADPWVPFLRRLPV